MLLFTGELKEGSSQVKGERERDSPLESQYSTQGSLRECHAERIKEQEGEDSSGDRELSETAISEQTHPWLPMI